MNLLDRLMGTAIKEPVFLKTESNAQIQLAQLEELHKTAIGNTKTQLEQEIRNVAAGMAGERAIEFELRNSHMPILVLHDLYLVHNDLSAQIDYLVITRKRTFVIECKNLYGNIEINSNGDFIRTITFGNKYTKEGIYSPITQNKRHLELIKQLRLQNKEGTLVKALFERNFYDIYRPVVVLANPKTVINMKYAKKEVKAQIIRADQIIEYIRKTNEEPGVITSTAQDMLQLGQLFLSSHQENPIDYAAKYRTASTNEKPTTSEKKEPEQKPTPETETNPKCPRCGATMIKRTASRGANAGSIFWGCPNYPKCKGIITAQ